MKKKLTRITKPLTTTSLIATVAADVDKPAAEVHEVLMAAFDVIARATASGHKVAITNFGTWFPYRVKRHTNRNPQTGEPVIVEAHQAVKFRPSDRLVELVRKRDRRASIRKLPKGSGGR
ncbi:HU family DNA-binding protein [Streptomyces mirabilis]|uniref:HU family DNA-binding protein n=1 Tax=Streptomyces mirabilis TaxID=68239 RepID=UPI0036980608